MVKKSMPAFQATQAAVLYHGSPGDYETVYNKQDDEDNTKNGEVAGGSATAAEQ